MFDYIPERMNSKFEDFVDFSFFFFLPFFTLGDFDVCIFIKFWIRSFKLDYTRGWSKFRICLNSENLTQS